MKKRLLGTTVFYASSSITSKESRNIWKTSIGELWVEYDMCQVTQYDCHHMQVHAKLEEQERKRRQAQHNDLYQRNLAKKAKLHYEANYSVCEGILMQIVDFSTKLVHYRELTKK